MSDFDIKYQYEGGVTVAFLVSPSTMDSNDTVDITNLLHGRKLVGLSAWDISTTNGVDSVTATYAVATDIITVDAAGGTTDSTYVLRVELMNTNSAK